MGASLEEIQRSLRLLYLPGDTIEMRSLGDRIGNGYFRDQNKLTQAALDLSNAGQNVYCCLNPVQPELFARRADQFGNAARGTATKDQDIPCRAWFLIDVDPVRPAGVSATDQQKQCAIDLAKLVYAWLQTELGSEGRHGKRT